MKTRTRATCGALVCALLMTIGNLNANPQERATLCKSLLTQRLVQDGWQLKQDSNSLLVFERQAGFGQTFLMNAMTGASSTWSVVRLTVTVMPVSNTTTNVNSVFSVNNQNAFGQVTSVPIGNNKKDAQYTASVYQWVNDRLPSKHKKEMTSR